jgi:hypothetical protein
MVLEPKLVMKGNRFFIEPVEDGSLFSYDYGIVEKILEKVKEVLRNFELGSFVPDCSLSFRLLKIHGSRGDFLVKPDDRYKLCIVPVSSNKVLILSFPSDCRIFLDRKEGVLNRVVVDAVNGLKGSVCAVGLGKFTEDELLSLVKIIHGGK